jgi:hypothetical protein
MISPFASCVSVESFEPFLSEQQVERIRYARLMLKHHQNLDRSTSTCVCDIKLQSHSKTKKIHKHTKHAGILMVTHKKPFKVRFVSKP